MSNSVGLKFCCFFPRKAVFSDWLGSRDSNPDSMIQSHVSCHWTTSQRQRHINGFGDVFQACAALCSALGVVY